MKINFWLILILTLALFLRFWNLPELLHFTLDEELEAFIVRNIITGFHYPAIGVSVAPVGIHLSPVFYYLAAIPFWLGNANPLIWGVCASMLGVVTTFVIYWTTTRMFSRRIGLIAALLYASSFWVVLYDRHFWNVTPMPLISAVAIFSLYQLIQGRYKWVIPLSLVLGLGLSSHMSTVSLFVLVGVVWWRDRLVFLNKYTLIGFMVLFTSQLPLLFFELRHQFSQTDALIKFLNAEKSGLDVNRVWQNLLLLPQVIARTIYTFGPHDLAREHVYGGVEIAARNSRIPVLMLWLSVVILGVWGWLVKQNFKNHGYKLHSALILIGIASLVFYGLLFKGGIYEFYLLILAPSIVVILAVIVDFIWRKKKFFGLVILGSIVVANIYATLTSYHSYSFGRKLEIISWTEDLIADRPYTLHSVGVNHKYEGYRYLFDYFYKIPTNSYVDPQLAWLYPVTDPRSPELMVVITSNEPDYKEQIMDERNQFVDQLVAERDFGEINVMIVTVKNDGI